MSTKVSVLDLTAGQVQDIEQRIGVPVTGWGSDVKSVMELYVLILSASTGEPEQKYRDMRLKDILDLVSLEDSDPNP